MTATKPMTAEELAALPDDGYRYELVRGELVRMAPAGGWHGQIGMRFGRYIGVYVDEQKLGAVFNAETGFFFARDPDVVRAPDVAFVRTSRLPPEEDRWGYLPLAPDLAVEVVSPSDAMTDVLDKVLAYLEAGTQMVVVVLPRRQVLQVYGPDRTARVLGLDDIFDGGDVLPGFRLPVAAIFR